LIEVVSGLRLRLGHGAKASQPNVFGRSAVQR